MTKTPTAEQRQALEAFAAIYGRGWKAKLNDAWLNGRDVYAIPAGGHFLRQVRNNLGPGWLATFKLEN